MPFRWALFLKIAINDISPFFSINKGPALAAPAARRALFLRPALDSGITKRYDFNIKSITSTPIKGGNFMEEKALTAKKSGFSMLPL